ncbi:Lysophospholipase D gdpd1 [Thoreauomyces humboldtii]|nr:Lysophospholipase D gdpd1 [Thoreauomyces humboldtii]
MSHRGGSLEHVENTLPAFRYSANVLKVDLLELDCYLTKDGQVVIFHDLDLTRMCGLPGKTIGDYNYADLPPLLIPASLQQHYATRGADPDATRIPLLTELLDEVGSYPIQLDVKLGTQELVQKTSDILIRYNKQTSTVWGSFREPQNSWCRSINPSIPSFFTLRRLLRTFLAWSVGLMRFVDVVDSALIMPNVKWFMWPGFASALNRRGVAVIVFGIPGGGLNDEVNWEKARRFGANGICSDRPTALQKWLRNNPLNRVDGGGSKTKDL